MYYVNRYGNSAIIKMPFTMLILLYATTMQILKWIAFIICALLLFYFLLRANKESDGDDISDYFD